MTDPLILLHEEALSATHPVFHAAPKATKAIYVWDDDYFKKANYSLKRLVFIYETLCNLPVEIIQGDTLAVARQFAPSTLYIPNSNNPLIVAIVAKLKNEVVVELVVDEPFITLPFSYEFTRFFQYWNKVKKSKLMI